MTNTTVNRIVHADLGMPVSGRIWVSALRALPMTDAAFATFPGFHAWSPPS